MPHPEQGPEPQEEAREPEPVWLDPDTRWKLANEAWLQEHWKLVLPVIIAVGLILFVLPWVFLSFLPALGIQLFSVLGLYLVGRRYTTAFDRRR